MGESRVSVLLQAHDSISPQIDLHHHCRGSITISRCGVTDLGFQI